MSQAHRTLLPTLFLLESVSSVRCRNVGQSAGRQWISPFEETIYKVPVVSCTALSVMSLIDS